MTQRLKPGQVLLLGDSPVPPPGSISFEGVDAEVLAGHLHQMWRRAFELQSQLHASHRKISQLEMMVVTLGDVQGSATEVIDELEDVRTYAESIVETLSAILGDRDVAATP